jgi:two-component system CheB/CheR fusion protein
VLISVTSFFRNPDAFDVLRRKVWPALLQQRGDEPFRAWCLGCSTGQEAYSIAMSFVEAAEKAPRMRELQVFATDLNDALLDKARHGLYAKNVAQDLSPERLRRFFVEEEGGYRVSKALREMIVFARHNVMSDPPFSRLNLISCRNLLIYFEPGLQKKVFPVFHYALKPGGVLYLARRSRSEDSPSSSSRSTKSTRSTPRRRRRRRCFTCPPRGSAPRPPPLRRRREPLERHADQAAEADGFRGELSAQREADRVAVNQFAPPAVLINADLQILQFRVRPPVSRAAHRESELRSAEDGAEGLRCPARRHQQGRKRERDGAEGACADRGERPRAGGRHRGHPAQEPAGALLSRSVQGGGRTRCARRRPSVGSRRSRRPARGVAPERPLEAELAEMRDYAQSIQEQHEAANEELQASNEEVQSANEELQSINEELETSKEELESANEELTTVNEEMANRHAELKRLHSDLINIQTAAHQAIVLLGRDLTIRRFSVPAEKQLNLMASDVGRPFSHVRHNLAGSDLDACITEAIDGVRVSEREVQDKDGRWFSLRVRPYLTPENTVDGAVLVLVDINDLKRSELAIAPRESMRKHHRDHARTAPRARSASARGKRQPRVLPDIRRDTGGDHREVHLRAGQRSMGHSRVAGVARRDPASEPHHRGLSRRVGLRAPGSPEHAAQRQTHAQRRGRPGPDRHGCRRTSRSATRSKPPSATARNGIAPVRSGSRRGVCL